MNYNKNIPAVSYLEEEQHNMDLGVIKKGFCKAGAGFTLENEKKVETIPSLCLVEDIFCFSWPENDLARLTFTPPNNFPFKPTK